MRFNRLELAGSMGDLGTLLPLAIGMILVNGLTPTGIFFTVGIFYIFSGLYFRVTTAVQPMKVISAYAVATALSAQQIMAATLLMAVILIIVGFSGAISWISKHTPKPVIRGVQLSTGLLLMAQGIKCMVGTSTLQKLNHMAEPYLAWQHIGPLPIGIPMGIVGVVLTLLLLDNRRLPAGLVVIGFGLMMGLCLGAFKSLDGFGLKVTIPGLLPLGLPATVDFTFAFLALVLPQIPMTIGNAVLANADLSNQYFGDAARKVTGRSLCISMAFANLLAFVFGGMPMCHGAGGLAAHYRFGARTAGSNLMIGSAMVAAVILFGGRLLSLFHLIPIAVLGVLLFFAGGQLALTITDMQKRSEMFIALSMVGIALATNLAVGFLAGLFLAFVLRWRRLNP
ncbi:MAG: putative sulfate/molybdate transporter [Desulfobacteraceae bacterium]|jgi:SulP family sulfate permease